MIILSFDVETTGVDPANDRVIEVGAILYSTGQRKCLESAGFLVKSDLPISEEVTKLTGITQAAVDRFGFESRDALDNVLAMANLAEAWIGQNVKRFDRRVLEAWGVREHYSAMTEVFTKLWIDTMTDLPGVEGKHLGYMAADHGFLNMFPHSALADCQTVIKLVEKYDIEKVVERAKSPDLILQAHQDRSDNDLAKKRRFRWNPERKIWWKIVKEMDLDAVVKEVPFDVAVRRDLTVDELWSD